MPRQPVLLASLVAVLTVGTAYGDGWSKYVAADQSFSVHYPAGWQVSPGEGTVEFTCEATAERLTLLSLPAGLGATPRAMAERVVELVRQDQIPDLTVQEWREGEQPESGIGFAASYTEGGQPYLGEALVAKAEDGGLWVSYAAPQAGYSAVRAQALLAAVVGSLAEGDRSTPPDATPAAGEGRGEPLPTAGLVDGRPQGLFVGVSVLSGNPASMLFLDGGRVYHGIPAAGLNRVDWEQLQAEHSNRCSRWEMQGGTLRILWPDGNVWESPLEPTATGFSFNGKSYGAVHPVDMGHLAGSWEGTKSTAWLNVGYGPAMTQINSLQVAQDGSYSWGVSTGGEVEGAATYSEAAFAGRVEIDGYEAVFHAGDGETRRLSLARWTDPDTLIMGGAFYFRK